MRVGANEFRERKLKVSKMRKLMTTIFVTAVSLVAVSLAVEQLSHLKSFAQRLTHHAFLSSVAAGDVSEADLSSASPAPSAETAASDSSDEFHWNGRLAAGRTIEIKGINGGVHAEPSSGGEVEVTALKSGRRSDPKGVEIRVVEHEGGVTICAVYPSGDLNRPNDCQPGEGGHSSVHDNDVQVEFKVRVPQGVRFSGHTVNGDVETGALGSDVEAKTVNGSIKISAAGIARAKTVNGSITASLGRANWTDSLEFKTVNGGITLDLPADLNAEVRAETLNGDIQTDFPLTILGRFSRRQLNGTIGSGGRELLLKTVNGSIRLQHRAA